MLTCREMSDLASDYLEGRARWSESASARLHLMMCRHCRRYFRQLRLTITAIRATKPGHPPVDPAKVVDEIERRRSG
ncbi:MAG: zf-HC2 domain-containing protein [Proteobacteria bacterium]|nr:zf-HC2 domain-containing protein [Pseudomonadota bacterium]